MSGCFGESREDKWKENISLSEFEVEDQNEELICEWCSKAYSVDESGAREPETYCSPSCRSLHYEYYDEPIDSGLGDGEL